jgi:hypothetical protein
MMTLTFDTLQFVQRLKKAGVKEMEAEAIAEGFRDFQTNIDATVKHDLAAFETDLATKRDIMTLEVKIAEIKRDLEVKIVETKRDLDVKIAETKAELIKWVVSVGVLQTAIIGALVLKLVSN